MLNNINTTAFRSVSFGNKHPLKTQVQEKNEFDLSNGAHTDAEAASVIGAAAFGGISAARFSKSAIVKKIGDFSINFGDDALRHSRQLAKVALKVGKGSYNILKETGEILVKVVPSLLLKFVK